MVKRGLIFTIPLLLLLWRCPAGPPTGPDTDISMNLSVNCLISPYEDTLRIYISRWSELNEVEFENSITPETEINIFWDYWSVNGARVTIAVDGQYQNIEEDSIVRYNDFRKTYHYYFYKFPSVGIFPGQHWKLSVSHPDYDSLYAEAIVPDSVEFIDLPDTIRDDSADLYFSWTQADDAEGYLPYLSFYAEKENGEYMQQEICPDWEVYYEDGEPVGMGTSAFPQKNIIIKYPVASVIEQIDFFMSETDGISQYNIFCLQFYVYSLNEALYNIQRWEVQPDELSGFNAPLQVFSNVENGSGILGAFWRTTSRKIIIDRDFIIEQCQ